MNDYYQPIICRIYTDNSFSPRATVGIRRFSRWYLERRGKGESGPSPESLSSDREGRHADRDSAAATSLFLSTETQYAFNSSPDQINLSLLTRGGPLTDLCRLNYSPYTRARFSMFSTRWIDISFPPNDTPNNNKYARIYFGN